MSRKRYITTDISLSGKIEELGRIAGEYAVILWTWMLPHLDDWGRMEGEADKVFYTVTPRFAKLERSPEDAEQALQAMTDLELLQRYSVNGKIYIQVNLDSFYELQTYIPKIKRKVDNSNYPPPPSPFFENEVAQSSTELQQVAQNTPSPSPSLTPIKDIPPVVPQGEDSPKPPKPDKVDNTPYEKIVDLYNNTCKSLPKVRDLTDARKRAIRARYKQHPDFAYFEKLFRMAQDSAFLTGGSDGNGWAANFDWLMKENNGAKVLEGTYKNRASPSNSHNKDHNKGVRNNVNNTRGNLYSPGQLDSLVIR